MNNDVLSMDQPNLRGSDSNSLLRMYDLASNTFNTSPFQQERARAEKAIRRIAKELRKRNVPL